MMGGTVTVVSHTALSAVVVTLALGRLVDTITDVVISFQTGTRNEIHYKYEWRNAIKKA